MGTVFPKEKWRSSRALMFTVTHLREKLSHLGPHSGSIISCTGLFLNDAHGKKTGSWRWMYGVSDVSGGYPARPEQEVGHVCPCQ